MGEVTSYTKTKIDEFKSASVVSGAVVGNDLILTRGDATTIVIPLPEGNVGDVTQADLDNAIAALVDSSPATLNTLNELAAALGDDANFATTTTNALALKAPLASPVFTGNPTAPTPSAEDNDTSIATTAFVKGLFAGQALIQEVVNNLGNTGSAYTIPDVTVATIHNVTLNAATVTFTMPAAGAGKSFVVNVKQDATGGRVAVFTGVIWPGGSAPTLSTTAGRVDELIFRCSDVAVGWRGSLGGVNFTS